jgi:hypothetical protein
MQGVAYVPPPQLCELSFDALAVTPVGAGGLAYRAAIEGWAGGARIMGVGGFIGAERGALTLGPALPEVYDPAHGVPLIDLAWRLSRNRQFWDTPAIFQRAFYDVIVCGADEVAARFLRLLTPDWPIGRIAAIAAAPGEDPPDDDLFAAAAPFERLGRRSFEAFLIPNPDRVREFEQLIAAHEWSRGKPVLARQGLSIETDDLTYAYREALRPVARGVNQRILSLPEDVKRLARELALRRAADQGGGRIALYGAGQHTERFLREIAGQPRARVVALLDDAAKSRGERHGLPLIPPAELPAADVDAVILSSDAFEEALWEAARPLRERGVRVLRVYEPGREVESTQA